MQKAVYVLLPSCSIGVISEIQETSRIHKAAATLIRKNPSTPGILHTGMYSRFPRLSKMKKEAQCCLTSGHGYRNGDQIQWGSGLVSKQNPGDGRHHMRRGC